LTVALTCARARLQDGQAILELGCGWGSLTLFMAQAYRNSTITAVSNSNTQREFIMRRARDLDLNNVQVITADMVDFQVRVWGSRAQGVGGGGGTTGSTEGACTRHGTWTCTACRSSQQTWWTSRWGCGGHRMGGGDNRAHRGCMHQAWDLDLHSVQVITADVVDFQVRVLGAGAHGGGGLGGGGGGWTMGPTEGGGIDEVI
jgi:hypothetical protein